MFIFNKNDRIITVFAESGRGPGWANQPLWVILEDHITGVMRQECIQPQDHTLLINNLYTISENVHKQLVGEVSKIAKRRTK